jgi:hypothetical protein
MGVQVPPRTPSLHDGTADHPVCGFVRRPDGDGFLLSNVWRSESDMRPFYDDVALPRLAEAGLQHEES